MRVLTQKTKEDYSSDNIFLEIMENTEHLINSYFWYNYLKNIIIKTYWVG